jgi:BNR/Asp-box repeat
MRTCAITMLLPAALTIAALPAAAQWQPVTAELVQEHKPGFGGVCGVAVDHKNGDVYIDLSDRGIFRSTDQGKSWQRVGTVIKGRTEWPGCLMLDPVGGTKKLVVALVYGAPIAVRADADAAWAFLDKKAQHIDWCAVDWTDPAMPLIFALKHESGDLLIVSRDGGKSFEDVGKGYASAWVFDSKTAVVAEAKSKTKPNPRLLRTTDAGKTFTAGPEHTARALPRWHGDTLYWLVDGALIATTDQGQSWKKRCDLKDGRFGPIFGKDGKHLFVLTGAGILESTDDGASWGKALPVPKAMGGVSTLSWMEYDPVHDILYVMKMGSDLYRLERGR